MLDGPSPSKRHPGLRDRKDAVSPSGLRRAEVQSLGEITFDRSNFQANPTKSDMAVGTHEIERWFGNLRAGKFRVIDWIDRNHMNAHQVAEIWRSF
jgi:hypothetical protein